MADQHRLKGVLQAPQARERGGLGLGVRRQVRVGHRSPPPHPRDDRWGDEQGQPAPRHEPRSERRGPCLAGGAIERRKRARGPRLGALPHGERARCGARHRGVACGDVVIGIAHLRDWKGTGRVGHREVMERLASPDPAALRLDPHRRLSRIGAEARGPVDRRLRPQRYVTNPRHGDVHVQRLPDAGLGRLDGEIERESVGHHAWGIGGPAGHGERQHADRHGVAPQRVALLTTEERETHRHGVLHRGRGDGHAPHGEREHDLVGHEQVHPATPHEPRRSRLAG